MSPKAGRILWCVYGPNGGWRGFGIFTWFSDSEKNTKYHYTRLSMMSQYAGYEGGYALFFASQRNMNHYLRDDEVWVEHVCLPSNFRNGTSCHMTFKSQVASLLDLVVGRENGHLRQTWAQWRRQHKRIAMNTVRRWWWLQRWAFFSSSKKIKKHRAKNSLICFLATRCS